MTRVLSMLNVIKQRLLTVNGSGQEGIDLGDRVFIGREDIFAAKADDTNFPCASILEDDETDVSNADIPDRKVMELPITIVAATVSDPDNPLVAGHKLYGDVARALFNPGTTATGNDRLNGYAMKFEFTGRQIVPRDDGGKITAVYIDCRATYVLQPGNPDL
ncbi:MAG TPA: hypothetical protein VHE37_09020 [Nevskiaceae bacterium]|nr:hypothetical protein [Nevskiaceae bacterium]